MPHEETMPKYKLNASKQGIDIHIEEIEGQEAELLEAFKACQRGECSCPTEEYKKLESMAVDNQEGGIQIQLTAKADEALDVSEIERCLDYTTSQVGKKKKEQ
jgi:hypothetical protein